MDVPQTPPALFFHCQTVYEAMWADAEDRKVTEEVELEPGASGWIKVWEGSGVRLIDDLNFSSPYYSKVFGALQRMDCIRQIRRGGGGAPSQWLLLQAPTIELFESMDVLSTPSVVAREMTQQQLNDLARRISRLETAMFNREGGAA